MKKTNRLVETACSGAVALLALASPSQGQCPATFAVPTSYAVGVNPRWVAVGDLDGDGRSDLAVANRISATVSVLLGNGNGTFKTAVSYGVGLQPYTVLAADVDGDGDLDLATPNLGSDSVSVLLGAGNGTFAAATSYAVGDGPTSIASGDFNADGRTDLAAVMLFSTHLSLLAGVGDGTFQPATNHPLGFHSFSVAAGDLDADGVSDLAIADEVGDAMTILLADGAGGFKPAAAHPVGDSPFAAVVVDLDEDGLLDVASANQTGSGAVGTVSVLLGSGDGEFQAALTYSAGANPYMVAVGDLNADGTPDVAVPNAANGEKVSLFLGSGSGELQPPTTITAGNHPFCAGVGDFNQDGRCDLVIANYAANSVSIHLNTSNPNFTAPTVIEQPASLVLAGAGQRATLSVAVDGHGNPLAFRWRRNGQPLYDGGGISGAATDTLVLESAALDDIGCYDVRISSPACGGGVLTVTSGPATVAVTACPTDFNGDGTTDGADLGVLLSAWGLCP